MYSLLYLFQSLYWLKYRQGQHRCCFRIKAFDVFVNWEKKSNTWLIPQYADVYTQVKGALETPLTAAGLHRPRHLTFDTSPSRSHFTRKLVRYTLTPGRTAHRSRRPLKMMSNQLEHSRSNVRRKVTVGSRDKTSISFRRLKPSVLLLEAPSLALIAIERYVHVRNRALRNVHLPLGTSNASSSDHMVAASVTIG